MSTKLETYHPEPKQAPKESSWFWGIIRWWLDNLKASVSQPQKWEKLTSIADYKKQELIKKTGGTEDNPYNLEQYKG